MRHIKTDFFDASGKRVHTNSGTNVDKAVGQCVYRMRANHYPDAVVAQVYDARSGELHVDVKRLPNGQFQTMEPKPGRAILAGAALARLGVRP